MNRQQRMAARRKARWRARMKEKGYRERRWWLTDEEAAALRQYLKRLRDTPERVEGTPADYTETLETPGAQVSVSPETGGEAPEKPRRLPETSGKAPAEVTGSRGESWYDTIFGWLLVAALCWVLWWLLF